MENGRVSEFLGGFKSFRPKKRRKTVDKRCENGFVRLFASRLVGSPDQVRPGAKLELSLGNPGNWGRDFSEFPGFPGAVVSLAPVLCIPNKRPPNVDL
jgi:hypothetical protein